MEIKERLIHLLDQNPDGLPQSSLARILKVSKGYLSVLLRDLEKQGIVYRVKVGNVYIVKLARPFKKSVSNMFKIGIVWSSEYIFLGAFAKLLREKLGLELKVLVYPSALQATLSLIRGEVDGVLSPLITQLYAYMLTRSLLIVGGGASGGAAIYEIPYAKSDAVASSELSTMDVCRAIAIKKHIIDVSETRYFYDPNEALRLAKLGKVRYLVVWHPITEHLKHIDAREIAKCSDFEELKHCCTLALSMTLPNDTIEKISKIYRESVEVFKKKPELYLEWYSALTNIDTSMLRNALKSYSYEPDVDMKSIGRLLSTLGIEVPTRESILRSIYS